MDFAEKMDGSIQSQTIFCYDLKVVIGAYRSANLGRVMVKVLPWLR